MSVVRGLSSIQSVLSHWSNLGHQQAPCPCPQRPFPCRLNCGKFFTQTSSRNLHESKRWASSHLVIMSSFAFRVLRIDRFWLSNVSGDASRIVLKTWVKSKQPKLSSWKTIFHGCQELLMFDTWLPPSSPASIVSSVVTPSTYPQFSCRKKKYGCRI